MSDSKKKETTELKFNPIDKDKIAENPHILPYAHTVGSSVIKPIDKGRVKGLAVSAMYDQTEMQLDQIREQVTLLAAQAEKIHQRVRISEKIYLADINFKPLIGHSYHLYIKANDADLQILIDRYFAHPKPTIWGDKFHKIDGMSDTESLLACYPEMLATRANLYAQLADITIPSSALTDPNLDDTGILPLISAYLPTEITADKT